MPGNQIAIYAGILLIALGAVVWLLQKPSGPQQNVIKAPGGFEFSLATPAFVVMALGIILVLIALSYSGSAPSESKNPSTVQSSQPAPTNASKAPRKYRVCTGEREIGCAGEHDVFYECGYFGTDDMIAAKLCEGDVYRAVRLNTKGGDKCGYALIGVTCN